MIHPLLGGEGRGEGERELCLSCFTQFLRPKKRAFRAGPVKLIPMFPLVATKDPTAVAGEVQAAHLAMFPQGDQMAVSRAFSWAVDCFTGHYADYQSIDAGYHDLEHTMQGTLCMFRLLRGRHQAGAQPVLTPKMFQLGLLAILFHDSGYLKHRADVHGTGAKYTVVHVTRSAEFAAKLLKEKGFADADRQAVQNMIHCTGVEAHLNAIPFQSELERTVGFALGTGDLLGQMAADDYVDKLPVLFAEFAEAAKHDGAKARMVAGFDSADDLMRKTPAFWEKFVLPKLDRDFGGMHRFLNQPCPAGPNFYLQRIEANIDRLRRELAAA
jgi:hypothetical protein